MNIGTNSDLSKDNIFKSLNQKDIWNFYFGIELDLDRAIRKKIRFTNPIRDDKYPGCTFFYRTDGKIIFHDWSYGNKYDCIDFVMSRYKIGFYDALKTINRDFGLNLMESRCSEKLQLVDHHVGKVDLREIELEDERNTESFSKILQIRDQNFTNRDISYWKSYGATVKDLKIYQIYSARIVFLDEKPIYHYTLSNPSYGYLNDSGKMKIYWPFEKRKDRRFLSNTSVDDVQGYSQLPGSGEMLIVTKSLKDVVSLSKFKIPSIAPQSESVLLPEWCVEDVKKRFKNIFILYDNDQPGIENSKKLSEHTGWNRKFIHPNLSKDFSDLRKFHGQDQAGKWINENLL